MSDETLPPTRWEQVPTDATSRYADTFTRLHERGEDIDGEARLADALAPRAARILDAGSGMGRVAAALVRRGHDVTAVEKDPDLVSLSRRLFPDVPVIVADILQLTPQLLASAGRPAAYDLVVVVGNVMVYLADGTEVHALRTMGDLLADGGRMLLGFHPRSGPQGSREYPVDDLRRHVGQAGLEVVHVFGSYELAPPATDYVVAVLARPR